MSNKSRPPKAPAISKISRMIGGVPPVLPGESEEVYREGLAATLSELQAETPLQVYLAEKIFDCLWWIRRYEVQKRSTVVRAMGQRLKPRSKEEDEDAEFDQALLMMALSENKWEHHLLNAALDQNHLTPEALLQEATYNCRGYLEHLEESIALKVKTLSALQSAYEALANRRVNAERLRLQNELVRRDLEAIDVRPVAIERSKA